jgi:hypothetical protein
MFAWLASLLLPSARWSRVDSLFQGHPPCPMQNPTKWLDFSRKNCADSGSSGLRKLHVLIDEELGELAVGRTRVTEAAALAQIIAQHIEHGLDAQVARA